MNTEEKIVTVLDFKTKNEKTHIGDAMLAVFAFAEWNESSNSSTFKSISLCRLLLTCFFSNADGVKRDMMHEFSVVNENLVQLTIISAVKPVLREKTLQDCLPTLKFTLHNIEQGQLGNLI